MRHIVLMQVMSPPVKAAEASGLDGSFPDPQSWLFQSHRKNDVRSHQPITEKPPHSPEEEARQCY